MPRQPSSSPQPSSANVGDSLGPDRRPIPDGATGTPRWVKLFVGLAAVVILTLLVLQFVGGGQHGPGRHDTGAAPSPTSAAGTDHEPPAAAHGEVEQP